MLPHDVGLDNEEKKSNWPRLFPKIVTLIKEMPTKKFVFCRNVNMMFYTPHQVTISQFGSYKHKEEIIRNMKITANDFGYSDILYCLSCHP